jgi:hypothetical protein
MPPSLRKNFDAVKWGAKRIPNNGLSLSFLDQSKVFILSLRKFCKEREEAGESVGDESADPIPFPLMCKLSLWSLDHGRVRDWAWAVWQWNLMCRSANVAPLRLRFFSQANDTVRVFFSRTKADQTGERSTWKSVYANSQQPEACAFLSMGCHLSVNQAHFHSGDDAVFNFSRGERGSTSAT